MIPPFFKIDLRFFPRSAFFSISGRQKADGCVGDEEGSDLNGGKASQVSVGEVDNMEDQRVVVEEFIQETEKVRDISLLLWNCVHLRQPPILLVVSFLEQGDK